MHRPGDSAGARALAARDGGPALGGMGHGVSQGVNKMAKEEEAYKWSTEDM